MSVYFVSVITVSAISSLAMAISYKSDGAVKCALTVFLLYVSAVPLINAVRDFDPSELDFGAITQTQYEYEINEMTKEAFENGIRLLVSDTFDLDSADVVVRVDGYDYTTVSAGKVTVTLKGTARFADRGAIKRCVEKNGLGVCEVKIEV